MATRQDILDPGSLMLAPVATTPVRAAWRDVPITTTTAALLATNLALLLFVCLLFIQVRSAHREADQAIVGGYQRLEIAHEIGRDANQLSRVARAYVTTREPRYRDYHGEMLAIQDGRVARPRVYNRTYWDLVIAGRATDRGGRNVSLETLARDAGFSPAEMSALARTKARLAQVAALETRIMRSQSPDAPAMLFDDRHAQAEAAVMKPLDGLLHMIEQRSATTASAAQGRSNTLVVGLYAVLCLAGGVAAASAWRLVDHVVRPLGRLSAVMTREAAAPGVGAIPYTGRADEIGRMARALEAFRSAAAERDALREAEQWVVKRRHDDEAAHGRALAEAGARMRRAGTVEALVEQLGRDLVGTMAAIRDASGELDQCARTMTLVAQSTERRVAEVEDGGRDTATRVDTVAATCRHLARTTGEIELQTNRSIASADEAVAAVRRTSATVNALMGHGESIGGIVTLIGSIAAKTNRLAINATIEAAHAGEAGRGFAVVASEVKSLARQTAAAANDISEQLKAVRDGSRETAAMVEAIAASIAESREITLAIGSAVEGQASATGDISANADHAATRTREGATSLATIRDTAGETRDAIARMLAAADALTGTSDAVNGFVARFGASVKAT